MHLEHHSMSSRTIEFHNHRPLHDFFFDHTKVKRPKSAVSRCSCHYPIVISQFLPQPYKPPSKYFIASIAFPAKPCNFSHHILSHCLYYTIREAPNRFSASRLSLCISIYKYTLLFSLITNMFKLFGPKNPLRHLRPGRRKAPPLYRDVKRWSPPEASYNCQSKDHGW
jgi:hypothetical protein